MQRMRVAAQPAAQRKMNSMAANALKTKGVHAVERALADQLKATVTVRGEVK